MSNPVTEGKNNNGFNLLAALQHNALGDADRLDREADEAERAARAARHEAAFLRALHGAAMAYESIRPAGMGMAKSLEGTQSTTQRAGRGVAGGQDSLNVRPPRGGNPEADAKT